MADQEARNEVDRQNREAGMTFIRRLQDLGIATGAFNVIDDDGVTWSVTLEKKA